MEVGAAVVPPRAAGPRRYKALAPWRFQSGFVREQVKHAAAAAAPRGSGGAVVGNSGAVGCRFGAAGTGGKSGGGREDCQLKRCTRSASVERSEEEKMENSGGRRVSGNDGDLGTPGSHGGAKGPVLEGLGIGGFGGVGTAAREDCGLEGSNGITTDTHVQNFRSGDTIGAGNGTACNMGIGSNVGAEKCISEGSNKSCPSGSGLKSKGFSGADCMSEKPEGNGGSTGNEAAKESDVAAKGCSVAGPGSNGNVTNCRKGRKVVAPWRFQIGYKQSFSKAFCSSSGPLKTPEYRVQGSSTQCTSATTSTVRCYASAYSSVRVSAMRDFSSVKGEKEISAYKKRKTDNDGHNQGMPNNRGAFARERVVRSLLDFQLIYRKLVDEKEHWSREVAPDLQAYKIFRERFSAECDDNKYVGSVPGIVIGDIFHMRVELCVVGLHRPHRVGVDHIKEEDGTCIAVSIVSYAQSSDVKNNLDVLVYSGSVTATVNQKIEGTNLALKKSMDTKTPIRVIHGFSTSGNSQKKKSRTYIYGGLYVVEKYWREKESEDCYVYMFRLRRMAGQKHVDIKETLKSGQVESYDSIIMKDLSQGLERIPISVVNSISDEYPMPYRYISGLQYPRNYQTAPPAGCACVDGCSDSKKCACAVKNGGEIPFNDKGRIIVAKPLVYECGPSCKCPPTCHNRVGQKGIKFRLQVFKTKLMGWGVKTLDFIPSGSFVCEYIGEVLDDEEAQKRTTDEYLFAIGHNYYDEALWEGLPRSIPSLQNGPGKDEETGFAVDASKMGNFAKFINHSCTPNLYAQNVLYDHDDKSVPHVMFFASENIHPYQELAYHYNYTIDQVHDVNGNIKKKKCLCGSIECDGWLY